MPIQTSGHRVEIMPTYSPINPAMVAFNPERITAGALSSIELMNELDKRKAFAAQQAEQASTRSGRVGALNAKNLATMDLAPRKSIADIALADQAAALAPGATQVGLGAQTAVLRNQANETELAPYKQDVAATEVMTAADLAQRKAQLATQQVDSDIETKPVQQALTLAKAREALGSITEDKNLSDQEKLAKIRQLNASAAASEATAAYTDRNRPKAGRQNTIDEAQKQLGHIEMTIARLERRKFVDPNADNEGLPVPIQNYQASTRDANGNIIAIPHIFSPDEKKKLNPEAEKVSAQLKEQYDLHAKYTKEIADALKEDLSPGAPQIDITAGLRGISPPAQGATVAPVVQAAAPVAPKAGAPLSPAQAASLPSGTVFLGTDGKQHVRK